MYQLIRSILFLFPAETAHTLTTGLLKFFLKIPGVGPAVNSIFNFKSEKLVKEVLGLKFPNPVGLAAGFDKNADYIHQLNAFGFGFIEIGTVTPKGQPGNPKPRLFRLKQDQGLINRMGFNNAGVQVCVEKLKQRPKGLIIGGNIGKNKITENTDAGKDYLICFEELYPYVDYFVVNVSSPNTPNLRELQDKEPLTDLLNSIQIENNKKSKRKPILLKIAPDLSQSQLDDIIEIVKDTKIDGLIATNTTIERSDLKTDIKKIEKIGAGGLSGKPVQLKSTEIIKYIKSKDPSLVIIGVGGIMDEKSALEKLDAGADLIQLYTGFVYSGPGIVKRINKAILDSFD